MREGDRVVCRRSAPATEIWRQFDGRTGTVRELHMGEIGVELDDAADDHLFYFLPTELRYANNSGAA